VVERVGAHRTAVLHPGDEWELDEPWTGTAANVARYARPAVPPGVLRRHGVRSLPDVLAAAEAGVAVLRAAHRRPLTRRLAPVTFRLLDLDERIVVHLDGGVRRLAPAEPSTACVVEASSQAVWYAFSTRWGLTTLAISGRLRVRGDEVPFTRLKQLGAATSSGFRTRGLVRDAASARGRRYLRHRWRDLAPELLRRAA
jgi:hypothetical protein